MMRFVPTTQTTARDHQITLEGGICDVSHPASNVILWKVQGNCPAAMAVQMIGTLEEMRSRGRTFYIFADCVQLKNYEGSFRDQLTDWFMKNRQSMAGLHVLHSSALVSMGLAIANAALRGFVTGYRDPAEFASAKRAIVTGPT